VVVVVPHARRAVRLVPAAPRPSLAGLTAATATSPGRGSRSSARCLSWQRLSCPRARSWRSTGRARAP